MDVRPPNERLLEIAERFGTPTYVYSLDGISKQLERLKLAVPEAAIHYAVKANPCGAVLKHLAEKDLGAEVITLGELERALRAGFKPESILLSGPGQTRAMAERAVEAGVRLASLDSLSQLELYNGSVSEMRFIVRLNPGLDPHTHEHMATGMAHSKFGLPFDTVLALAERLGDRLAGFHVHAGSQIEEVEVYDEVLQQCSVLYERFPNAKLFDIGGGFAVPGFPLEAFATRVRGFARRLELKIMIEPGRFLVSQAGVLLTRVLHVKEGVVTHVIADAGMAELLRPALYGAAHPICLLSEDGARPVRQVDIDGPLCENADRLGRSLEMPLPKPGDLLAVEQAGAYGLAMASNYASSLRPAEVVVQGGEAHLARERESVEDLFRLERF